MVILELAAFLMVSIFAIAAIFYTIPGSYYKWIDRMDFKITDIHFLIGIVPRLLIPIVALTSWMSYLMVNEGMVAKWWDKIEERMPTMSILILAAYGVIASLACVYFRNKTTLELRKLISKREIQK